MYLNTLSPKEGSKIAKFRVGRGTGTGIGKTCGKGHKGQKARSGGYRKVGFEGGQMPLQRRLPKFGFTSRTNLFTQELGLAALNNLEAIEVDLLTLKEAKLIKQDTQKVRIILSKKGDFNKQLNLKGIYVTAAVKEKITALGGTIA
ncbi:MAG: 50S ribosomal protein L15 [Gammaproteobacteria bacterium]